jgi:hypothetical protein
MQTGVVERRPLISDEVTIDTEARAASLEFTQPPALVRTITSMGSVVELSGAPHHSADRSRLRQDRP